MVTMFLGNQIAPANHDRHRAYPIWKPAEQQGEDAIISALVDFFWESTAEAIGLLMQWTLEIAKNAGLDVRAMASKGWPWPPQPGSKHDHTSTSYGIQPVAFEMTEEERVLKHIACCLFQTIGIFDLSIALEHRSDTLDTGFVVLDKLLAVDEARVFTRPVIRWGNAHGCIVYGSLCIETGIKTDDKTVAGILLTSRFNPRNKRPALRLVPMGSKEHKLRLDSTNMMELPSKSECRIAAHTPFAVVKEVIDGIFVQLNNRDPYSDAILDSFLQGTLKYQGAQSSRDPRKRENVRVEGVQKVLDTLRNYQDTGAYDALVRNRISAFARLVLDQPDITQWHAVTSNCQHFCYAVLKSRCFLRTDGYDGPHASSSASPNSTQTNAESSLPSVRKVFPLLNDQDPKLSPWFTEYFASVQRSSTAMVTFRDVQLGMTSVLGMQSRTSLLDLRRFGIPVLSANVEYSQTSGRLGVPSEESTDAWFALSAISLYFLWPENISIANTREGAESSLTLADRLNVGGMEISRALGILALGYFEWLEKAAHPRLLNTVAFSALRSLTDEEREWIRDGQKSTEMINAADRKVMNLGEKLQAKTKDGKSRRKLMKEMESAEERCLILRACREFEVELPQRRRLQRGRYDWLLKLG
ncbi:hypothetical protein NM688_g3940 [Phlebia brevispora]|uniref:Uncharacterized protein n=1 Tax=Phlebia brevispora TaxID=194682 RepID=A0ACC1T4D4_9APHY|nr:hypothetical protein NM688_g3940 [Phlebia brevispora]